MIKEMHIAHLLCTVYCVMLRKSDFPLCNTYSTFRLDSWMVMQCQTIIYSCIRLGKDL